MLFRILALSSGLLVGCSSTSSASSTPSAPSAPSASAGTSAATPALTVDPALVALLERHHARGVLVVHDPAANAWRTSDPRLAVQRYVPASTFKIPNTLLALELGVVQDASTPVPWDGRTYSFPDWNQDHTLRTAFRASCVPCYQRFARQIGLPAYQAWLPRLGYGNADPGAVVDAFWLRGPLAISPVEEVQFLVRLQQGTLPFSARTLGIMREVLLDEDREGRRLHGKTGWFGADGGPGKGKDEDGSGKEKAEGGSGQGKDEARGPGEDPSRVYDREDYGWYVGYLTEGPRTVFAAALLFSRGTEDFLKARRRIALDALSR